VLDGNVEREKKRDRLRERERLKRKRERLKRKRERDKEGKREREGEGERNLNCSSKVDESFIKILIFCKKKNLLQNSVVKSFSKTSAIIIILIIH
jgi:hypothetical protein